MLDELAKKKIFTINDAEELPSATNDLTELVEKGLIKRLGRGNYYIPKI